MAVKDIQMTPEMAKELLGKNTLNFRKPDIARVRRYANDMREGKWVFNGDTVKLSGEILLDGQHRLLAVVQSGMTVRMLLVSGISHEAGRTIDDGKPRTAGQWLTHLGVKNANNIAAIARWCIVYNKSLWKNSSTGVDGYSRSEIVEFVDLHHDELQSAYRMCSPSRSMMSASHHAALVLAASGMSDPAQNNMIVWFCRSLATGVDLSEDEPVFQLRSRLIVKHSAHKLTPFMQRMLLTIAWNKTAAGETCSFIRYRLTGPAKQKPINVITPAPENDE
jgi:hypothetical protein